MDKKTEALKLALEALETCDAGDYSTGHVIYPSYDEEAVTKAITAIKQALAQPEQEPVATLIDHYGFTDGVVRFDGVENMEQLPIGTKFYIAPLNVATPLAEQCVCGEPDTPGTHRTDGPCLAEQPAPAPEERKRQARSADTWVGLTDEDFGELCDSDLGTAGLIKAIEAKLKEKNG